MKIFPKCCMSLRVAVLLLVGISIQAWYDGFDARKTSKRHCRWFLSSKGVFEGIIRIWWPCCWNEFMKGWAVVLFVDGSCSYHPGWPVSDNRNDIWCGSKKILWNLRGRRVGGRSLPAVWILHSDMLSSFVVGNCSLHSSAATLIHTQHWQMAGAFCWRIWML